MVFLDGDGVGPKKSWDRDVTTKDTLNDLAHNRSGVKECYQPKVIPSGVENSY